VSIFENSKELTMYSSIKQDINLFADSCPSSKNLEVNLNTSIKKIFGPISDSWRRENDLSIQNYQLSPVVESIILFCKENGLSLHETIFICIKFLFEVTFIFNQIKSKNPNKKEKLDNSNPLNWLENCLEPELIESNKSSFGTHIEYFTRVLFPLLSSTFAECSIKFPNPSSFQIYFLSVVLNDLHLCKCIDTDVKLFEKHWDDNFTILNGMTADEKEKWWRLSSSFYGFQKEIGETYLQLESLRIRNSLIETKWLKTFSGKEMKLKDLLFQKKLLEMQITLKTHDKSLTNAKCLKKAKLELIEEERLLKELMTNSVLASFLDPSEMVRFLPEDSPVFQEYKQKAEVLFRIAVKLLHPDRRIYLLGDIKLNNEQEDELNKLYTEVISIRESGPINPAAFVSGDFYLVNKLKRIISRAEMILSSVGVVIPKIKFMILGDDYESQVDYMMNEYSLLQTELAQLQAESQILYSDKDIYKKDTILKNPESIEVINKRYETMIASCEKESEELNKELKTLFAR
jgi:hypothetical protein